MSFAEIQFPSAISYGSSGGPGFNTNIIQVDSGAEERVSRWESGKWKFDVSYGIKSQNDLHEVYKFYLARSGPAQGFRFKHWSDYATTSSGNTHVPISGSPQSTSSTDVQIGVGNGTQTRFQLIKRYVSGPSTKIRTITKPVSGKVKVSLGGVNQTSGWSVDTTTGEINFTSAPGNGVVVAAGFEFDVPVRFGKEIDDAIMGAINDFNQTSVGSIPLVEITDGLTVNDDANCGGAAEICISENYQLSAGFAKAYVVEPDASGLELILPDETLVPPGGPVFTILNVGPNSIDIVTYDSDAFITLDVDEGVSIILTVDGSNNKVWYAI